ncbi:hypothetical protein BU17DRAFT_62434 [Hysterangium stoloniferum]|nr:hypothetical protein BU17DRAFT_62434 [Hysterangium stoloniferum]
MPIAHGVQVWIEVDGVPLTEYEVAAEGRLVYNFYKKFSVRFRKIHAPMAGLRGNIFLDGISAGAGLLLSTDTHATTISGQTRWENYESPFVFAKLRTTDDEDEACQDERRLRDLGTVRVQMEWVQVVAQEAWRPPSNTLHDSTAQPIYERAKKASAHCTSLGDIEISRPKNWFATVRIPSIEPAEYIFKYAPLDWLNAEGITLSVPSSSAMSGSSKRRHESSTITPGNSESEVELLDPHEAEEYKRLKAKIACQKSRIDRGKRHRAVKQEPGPSILPGGRIGPPQVIDLTGDD